MRRLLLTMDRATQEIRYQEWFTRIQGWSQSGLSKSEYCTQNGIPIKTFYYYQRRIRARLAEQLEQGRSLPEGMEGCGLLPEASTPKPQIVKLNLPEQGFVPHDHPAGAVHFSVNGMAFVVEENINPSFLAKLIRAVDNGSC